MNKRPLCLVCLCFMICIWLFEILGITYGGDPLKHQEFEQCIQDNCYCQASGEVFRYEIRQDGTSYLYLKSTILVASTKQFSNYIIRVKFANTYEISIGNQVQVQGKLYEMPEATNPGQFDTAFYYRIQGIDGLMEGEELRILNCNRMFVEDSLWKLRERAKTLFAALTPDQAGVLSAMILGDKTLLEEETKTQYRLIGILHILAVSGTHLAVVSGALYAILLKAGCGRRMAGSIAVLLMILYGIFTGGSISVMRAVMMFGLSVGAEIVGRTYDMLSAMALSAIFLLVEHPGYLYDSGFLLSYGAVFGLAFLMPVMGKKWKTVKGGIAVFLVQLPILQYYFYEIPVFSLLINLIVIPLVPIVLGSGMVGLLLGTCNMSAGRLALLPARTVLEGYEWLGKLVGKISGATWITGQPEKWQLVIYALLMVGGVVWMKRLKKQGFWMVAILAMILLSFRMPTGFQITMLDVGQGDCLVIDTPAGNHYLIDGGSSSVNEVGEYRILPYLKSQGISSLEGIFVTHGDEDHINGILEILEEVENGTTSIGVQRIFLPRWMEQKEDQSLQMAAEDANVDIVYLKKGNVIRDGDVCVKVLHPDNGLYLEDENGGSLTLKVTFGEFDALLTGDLCGEGEVSVAAQDVECELLKVAHHGSKSSTTEEFLEEVKPQIALISCGENNRYGHPAQEVVERITDAGSRIFDTRECGAVTVKVSGENITIKKYLKGVSDL